MRASVISVLAIANAAFAVPPGINVAYQIEDGQVQAPTGYPASSWAITSSSTPSFTSIVAPVSSNPVAPPSYGSLSWSSASSVSSASVTVAPLATTSSPPAPPPSYPWPGNSSVPLVSTGLVTAPSTLPFPTQLTTRAFSSNAVGATSTPTGPVPTNAAVAVSAESWMMGAVFAGLMVLFA